MSPGHSPPSRNLSCSIVSGCGAAVLGGSSAAVPQAAAAHSVRNTPAIASTVLEPVVSGSAAADAPVAAAPPVTVAVAAVAPVRTTLLTAAAITVELPAVAPLSAATTTPLSPTEEVVRVVAPLSETVRVTARMPATRAPRAGDEDPAGRVVGGQSHEHLGAHEHQ